jgi:hypothetical protein
MAFTLKPDGSIQTDTAEELVALIALQQKAATPPLDDKAAPAAPKPKPRPLAEVKTAVSLSGQDMTAAYRQLYSDIDDQQQRALLLTLLSAPRAFTDSELRHGLNLKTNLDLRGSLIGIIRRAHNRHLPNPIVRHMTRTHGGARRAYRYGLTSEFRTAMDGYNVGERVAV